MANPNPAVNTQLQSQAKETQREIKTANNMEQDQEQLDALSSSQVKIVPGPGEAVERLGWGRFHLLLFFFVGIVVTSEYVLVMVVSFQLPVLETEWGLSKPILGMCGSMLFLGMLLGAGFWAKIADRKGRLVVLRWTISLGLFFSVADAAAVGVWMVALSKLGVGFCSTGAFTASYTLLSELTPVNLRTRVMLLIKLFFSFGSALAALGARATLGTGASWRVYLAVCAAPQLLALVFYRKVPESLRFLCAVGRVEEANEIVRRITKINTGDANAEPTFAIASHDASDHLQNTKVMLQSNLRGSFRVLIFGRGQRRTVAPLLAAQFAIALCFYTVTYSEPRLQAFRDSDEYMLTLVTIAAEVVGRVLPIFFVDTIGRKLSLAGASGAYAVTGVVAAAALNGSEPKLGAALAIMCIARLCGGTLWGVSHLYTLEAFPTILRGVAMGVISVVGRVGGIAASFVAEDLETTAMLVFVAAAASFCCLFSLLLPHDTTGVHLRDFIEESGLELIEVNPSHNESATIEHAWGSILDTPETPIEGTAEQSVGLAATTTI